MRGVKVILLEKETFEKEVLAAKGIILVDFFGDGCAPCAALMPAIESLEEKYGEQIKFTKLNTSKAMRLAISQGIMGLPVIALYENGNKIKELVKDDATPEAVEKMLKEAC